MGKVDRRGAVVFVKETRHVAICKRDNSSSRGTPTFPSHGASCASPVERLWSRSDRGPAAVELKPSTMLRRSKAMAAFLGMGVPHPIVLKPFIRSRGESTKIEREKWGS